MASRFRRKFTADFKAEVVAELDAVRKELGGSPYNYVSAKRGIHTSVLRYWDLRAKEGPAYQDRRAKKGGYRSRATAHLYKDQQRAPDIEKTPRAQVPAVRNEGERNLARRIEELEQQVRLLEAEKVVLMQTLHLVNGQRVRVT